MSGWKSESRASVEGVVAGQLRGAADVAAEHARPLHRREVAPEGEGDALLEMALAQADAQLAAEDGGDVAGAQRVGPTQQLGEHGRLGVAAAGAGQRVVPVRDIAQREQGPATRRHVTGLGQQLPHGGAQVRGAVVGAAQGAFVGTGHLLHDRGDGRPAQAGLALVALGERPTAQEHRREREVGLVEGTQVLGHDGALLRRLARGPDALGRLRPAPHPTGASRAHGPASRVIIPSS